MVAVVPTNPRWKVRARCVALDTGVGKMRWIVAGNEVEVQNESFAGSSKPFLELPGAEEDNLQKDVVRFWLSGGEGDGRYAHDFGFGVDPIPQIICGGHL